MTNDSRHFDVIIVGGGPAGCATALSIAKNDPAASLRVLLLDDADATTYKIGESLPASARRTLSMLHPSLSAKLAQDAAQGMHNVCTGNASAWASPHLQETYSLMNPYGAGWHLDRALFDETLREMCGPVLRKGKFMAIRRIDDQTEPPYGWEMSAEMVGSGAVETFRAKWIVDATGRRASVARKLGAKVRKHAELLSFYALFGQSDPDMVDSDNRTVIEAAPSGWWYTARLPHSKRLVMYTTSPSDTSARTARTAAGFLDMLHNETTHVAQIIRGAASEDAGDTAYEMETGSKHTHHTSACSAVLEPYAAWEPLSPCGGEKSGAAAGRGWCAVGDAALAFDPLSSQGMITALNAGAFLGGILARHFDIAEPSGEPTGQLDGESTAGAIRDAYEQVRVKYEEGRAYYYSIVSRFEVGDDEDCDDPAGREQKSFWKRLRDEPGAGMVHSRTL